MSMLQNNNTSRGSVLSFGEMLIKICPDADGSWLSNSQLPFYIGGAELNVASALALWEVPSKYFTVLPDNGLSAQLIGYLKYKGIDASAIRLDGKRIGIYYLTQGHDLKHDALIYDRSGSAFSELKTGMLDWDKILEGVSWFHFSAISPALNQDLAEVCREALEAASQKNITISTDLNYRSKLWQYGRPAAEVMPSLARYCDVIMGNIWAAETMLGIKVIPGIHETGQKSVYLKEALHTSKRIMAHYPKCRAVGNTFRFDATDDITYYTTLYTGGNFYSSKQYETRQVTDKAGSGDCFMAGLIYGFYNDLDPQQTLEFAAAAAFEKLFVKGDATDRTVTDIKKAMK